MGVLNNYLNHGFNQPSSRTALARISCWLGAWLARRGGATVIGEGTMISPDALINSRGMTLAVGEHCRIAPGAQIQGAVLIGNNSSVQSGTLIVGYEGGRVEIGNNVRIAAQGMIIAANHIFSDPHKLIREQGLAPADIIIEDDVWIAGGVRITAGVRIGRGSVVGAGAVVTSDIPPLSIAVGVPARVRATR